MKRIIKTAIALVALCILSGCATIEDRVCIPILGPLCGAPMEFHR